MRSAENSYQPSFSWKDNIIYDREKAIANFRAGGPGDLSLQNVVLKPGGEPLIRWVFSWQAQFNVFTNILDKIVVDDTDPERLELETVSSTPDRHYTSQVKMVLTYERKLGSYLYEVETILIRNKFPFVDWQDYCNKCTSYYLTVPLEYANILPLKSARWQYWIYKDVEGKWIKLPLNHLYPSGLYDIQFNRKKGLVGMFNSPEGNPVVHLLDNTPANSQGALCFSAWDMHLKAKLVMASRKYRVKYRLFSYDKERTNDIIHQAACQPYTKEELEEYERPRFEQGKRCDFRQGIEITEPDEAGFWVPFGDVSSSKWLKEGGYQSKGCIFTEGRKSVSSNWQVFGPFAPRARKGKKYILSAYVKTENLEGEGAYIFYRTPGARFDQKECSSPKLKCTHDWTKLEITIPSLSEETNIDLILQHKGKGKSYFSAVEFKEMGNYHGKQTQ